MVLGFFQTLKQNEDWKKNIFINVAAAYVFSTETVLKTLTRVFSWRTCKIKQKRRSSSLKTCAQSTECHEEEEEEEWKALSICLWKMWAGFRTVLVPQMPPRLFTLGNTFSCVLKSNVLQRSQIECSTAPYRKKKSRKL